jgi:hypothetical protein
LLFDHVIAYVIDDTYPYPLKYFNELDYYDIVYDKSKLYDPHKNTYDKLDLLINKTTEINNLVNEIYTLNVKIENINKNIHICTRRDQLCYYPTCESTSGINKFCNNHQKMFIDKCAYKYPSRNKWCTNIVDEKSKYCLVHNEYGVFCNIKNCRNFRIKDSEFCYLHC